MGLVGYSTNVGGSFGVAAAFPEPEEILQTSSLQQHAGAERFPLTRWHESRTTRGMVQVLVRLVASPGRVLDIVDGLRSVMRSAQQARGCSFAGVHLSAVDSRRILYVEEWDDACELRAEFGTERFHRMLELLEMAVDPPVVEFRIVSGTHGLEYISGPLPSKELDLA